MKNGILKCSAVLLGIFTIFTSNLYAKEIGTGTIKEGILGYKAPNAEAQVASYFNTGDKFAVVEDADKYYGILNEANEVIYIEKDYLDVEKAPAEAEQSSDTSAEQAKSSSKGEAVVNFAKQFIGLPYRSGGNSLQSGVDCSGFTQQVYANFDVSLERSSRSQYASNGKFVDKGELQPGDLVFYGYGSVNHVAIYIGNGQIIHAPVPGQSVCIVPIQQRGDAPIMGYKRIFF